MARPDADQHVPVPKLVKDRLIRIETKQTKFHNEVLERLDKLEGKNAETSDGECESSTCSGSSGVQVPRAEDD